MVLASYNTHLVASPGSVTATPSIVFLKAGSLPIPSVGRSEGTDTTVMCIAVSVSREAGPSDRMSCPSSPEEAGNGSANWQHGEKIE
jgi:hypothetical protein